MHYQKCIAVTPLSMRIRQVKQQAATSLACPCSEPTHPLRPLPGPCIPLFTSAMTLLTYDWAISLDYGGIQTSEAESGLFRAAKGGMLSAEQLRAILGLVLGVWEQGKSTRQERRSGDSRGDGQAERGQMCLSRGGRLSACAP